MAYKLKTTLMTGSQNFETYDEISQFRSSISAYEAFRSVHMHVRTSGMLIDSSSEKIDGGWIIYRTMRDKTEFRSLIESPDVAKLMSDIQSANDLLGWTSVEEVIEDTP